MHFKRTIYGLIIAAGWLTAGDAADVKLLDKLEGWGTAADPVGDCKFSLDQGTLTITVPGAYHDLWPLKGEVNAPLVLQNAQGDFTVEVKVAHVDPAEEGTVLPGLGSSMPFHAGTLVIWQNSKNFVRLDRTNMNRGGQTITSCYLHIFKDGERVAERAQAVQDRPTHLRLQRTGGRIIAAYSQDGGKKWQSFPPQRAQLPDKVKVGVAVINSTNQPIKVQFESLKVSHVD